MELGGDSAKVFDPPPPYNLQVDGGATTNLAYMPDKTDNDDIVISVDEKTTDGIPGKEEAEQEEDPWKITNFYVKVVPWSDLTTCGKVKRVLWDYFGKFVCLLGLLYMFICSLDFLGNAFKLIGGRAASSVFSESEVLSNPVAGLMIGILATVLFQSSSTTTSIIVSMVAAKLVPIRNAIPMVMGSNIGTSVTNTLVSIGQIGNQNEFRRAFAGATVHDMFNWLTVIILLPLESLTGYLYHLSEMTKNSMNLESSTGGDQEFLKTLTEPFTTLIIQVDKKIIEQIAHGIPEAMNKSIIKHCCVKEDVEVTKWNTSTHWNYSYTDSESVCLEKCKYLFEGVADSWGDTTVGIVLLVVALVILCACLILIVKTLNSMLKGKISYILKKFVNGDFPGKLAYFTGYLAILIGTGLTILVQSSSIFTSALTPLVGIGVISVERMYPLTLGANIGTTTTSVLAALAQSAEDIPLALQISLVHLYFNISGILLYFPIPYLRFPIGMAKALGNVTAHYRWFPILYLIFGFFLLPGAIFGLSLIGWQVMTGICGPIVFVLAIVVVINILQRKAPKCLPKILRNWMFLPEPLRSLDPLDRNIKKLTVFCRCCCKNKNKPENETKEVKEAEFQKTEFTKL
ncbi:sodium-dependent phosphate transport protein 2B-like isoform X2 [Ruditapes philippinarum]|uniref:sodium-dependent phosphate transport protein 2B-like isoform X2 n=1 Tax=Ruditapes philippinarum TaxID=129788 RepID=UPI00295AA1D7|nr:sodium-dependent phosphate transport protein 2B-like isoform X2 [Ruditapes philippinarum]